VVYPIYLRTFAVLHGPKPSHRAFIQEYRPTRDLENASWSDPARQVHVQDQEAILPGSDSARQVRLGIKKVLFYEQEAILPVSAASP
jgi:hypothetical protein